MVFHYLTRALLRLTLLASPPVGGFGFAFLPLPFSFVDGIFASPYQLPIRMPALFSTAVIVL
jgi:hypothetical protein